MSLSPRRKSLFACLAAALAGAVAVAGFAPLEWFPLAPLSLTALFLLWQSAATTRQTVAFGYAWGLGFFLTGVSWVYVSLHDVGDMALPLAAGATLLFCGGLALFPVAAAWGFARLRCRRLWWDALLLASLWTLSELLRGYLFTGFPWLALGYSQTPPSPLAGYAPLLGSYGVGWVAAFLAALLAGLVGASWRQRSVSLLAVSTLVLLGAGLRTVSWTEPSGQPFSISLLQGNIPQSLKWNPESLYLSIDSYSRLARDNPADLVVLPETAIPLFFDRIPRDVLSQITRHGPALIGSAVALDRGDDYTNSAVLLSPLGGGEFSAVSYSKQHLVPFGEYIPPGFAGFLRLVNIPLAGFTPGHEAQKPMDWNGQKLMPNICYEDLFGEEIRTALIGDSPATVLVNLSNTAWFGHSLAQPQHLQIARLRALETGRPMVRATNTGMTAAITPDGIVTDKLEPFTQGALTVMVQGRVGTTPYIRWGNGSALLLVLLGLASALLLARRRAVIKSTSA